MSAMEDNAVSTDVVQDDERVAALAPSKAANWILYAIVAIVVIFIAWAALATLDVVVRGQGRVVPSSQLQVVSNLEGGVIEEVFVKAGDTVTAEQPLMALDQTQRGGDLAISRSDSAALAARIARLQGEAAGRAPNFPAGGGAAMQQQIEIERALYQSRQANLSSLVAAGEARIRQAERAVEEARAQLDARQSAARAAQEELALIRPLVEDGIEPRIELVQAESRANSTRAEVAAAQANITRAQASVAEARSSLAQQRQDWRSAAANELSSANREFAAVRGSQPALAERLDRSVLRSPMSGRVNRVLKNTVGGSVVPGEPLIEIVPSEDTLLVTARIRPSDIGWVAIGQKAKVNITAYDPTVYGGLDGEVVTISPDAQTDERTGEPYYEVQVATAADAVVTDSGDRLPIGPGMTAEVSLISEKRSVLDYILRPITRLQQRAFRE